MLILTIYPTEIFLISPRARLVIKIFIKNIDKYQYFESKIFLIFRRLDIVDLDQPNLETFETLTLDRFWHKNDIFSHF